MTAKQALNKITKAWKDYTEGEISFEEMIEIKENTLNNITGSIKKNVMLNLQLLGLISK